MALAWAVVAVAVAAVAAEPPVFKIQVGAVPLWVEVAATPEVRARGLMDRDRLPPTRGMLFLFPRSERQTFWMRNTRIPLDIAFIDAAGIITQIETMAPQSERTYASRRPVRYALEVNRGWFRAHGVGVGDALRLPPDVRGLPVR